MAAGGDNPQGEAGQDPVGDRPGDQSRDWPARPPRRLRLLRLLWVAAYTLVIRLSVIVVTTLLFAYFALNSAFVAGQVSTLISDVLPGTISIEQLRFGPAPERIRVIGLDIKAPDGAAVVGVQWAALELPWWRIVHGLIAGERGMDLHIWRARLVGTRVRLENDAAGRMKLVQAFADPDEPPSTKPPAPFRLRIDRIETSHTNCLMDMNGVRIEAEDGDFDGNFLFATSAGKAEMRYEVEDLLLTRAGMHLDAYDAAGLPQMASGSFQIHSMAGTLTEVDVRGGEVDLGATRVKDLSMHVSWVPVPKVEIRHMDARTSSADPFVAGLLGPGFGFEANARGALIWQAPLLLDGQMKVSGAGTIAGFPLRDFAGDIRLRMGHSETDRMQVDATDVALHGFGGALRTPKLVYRMTSTSRHVVQSRLLFDGMSPAELLGSDPVAMQGGAVAAVEGALSGRADLSVDVGLVAGGEPPVDMEVDLDVDLQLARAERALFLSKALPKLYLRGAMKLAVGPERGLSVTLSALTLAAAVRADGSPDRRGSAEWLAADGDLDLQGAGTALRLEARLPELRNILEPLGIPGISGGLELKKVTVAGSMQQPGLSAELRLRDLRAYGHAITDLQTRVVLSEGKVTLARLSARLPEGTLRGDFSATLFGSRVGEPAPQRLVSGRNVVVGNLSLGGLLDKQGVRDIRGTADLSGASFELDLARPMASIRASGQLTLRGLRVRHQGVARLETGLRFAKGRLDLADLVVELPARQTNGAPGARGPQITGDVGLILAGTRYHMDLDVPEVDFDDFGDIKRLNMPLRGQISGHLLVDGDLHDLAVTADLRVGQLAWGEIAVGDADVSLRKVRGEPMKLSSGRFFKNIKLLGGSEIKFRRLVPEQLAMGLQATRLDPFAMLAMERPGGIKVRLDATSWVNVDLRPGKELFNVRTELPAGGAVVDPRHGLSPLNNTRPMTVVVHPDRVDIGSTFLAIGRDELEICGAFHYANAAAGEQARLAMYASGTLDVIRVGPLADSMAAMDMRIDIAKDPVVAADPAAACLTSLGMGRGALRLAGSLDALVPHGVLQLQRSVLTPRGMGQDLVLSSGGRVIIGHDRNGELRTRIPEDHPVEVRVEDGWLKAWGFVQMQGNAAQKMDLSLMANDVSYIQPKVMSLTASGGVRIIGDDLTDADGDKDREVSVRGDVQLSEAAYFKNHDKLGMMVTGLTNRESEGGSGSVFERTPWMQAIKLDVGLRAANVEVASRFPLVKTDIELGAKLQLEGTAGAPRIRGRVTLDPGSQVTYTLVKRDFEITRGSLDFRGEDWKQGFIDLSARSLIDVGEDVDTTTTSTMGIGLQRGGGGFGQSNIVTVVVQAAGTLDQLLKATGRGAERKDFKLLFTSTPPYEQGDIQSLIVTGRPLTSGSGGVLGSRATINLLVDDVAEAVTGMLLGSWSPKVEFGLRADGLSAKVKKNIGKAIKLSGEYSSTTERTETRAALSIRISENWSMEGMLRHELSTNAASASGNVYEGKAAYKVDLNKWRR